MRAKELALHSIGLVLAACAFMAHPSLAADVELPLRRSQGLLLVDVKLNGQEAMPMELDTGSEFTSLTPNASFRLKLSAATHRKANSQLGDELFGFCILDHLELGSLLSENLLVSTDHQDSVQLSGDRPLAGVLGMDVLGRRPFTIDFRRLKLILHEPDSFKPPADLEGFECYPFGLTPKIRASLEGHTGWFEIDTGERQRLKLSRAFLSLNRDIVAHRPQVQDGEPFGQKARWMTVRWNKLEFLGQKIDEATGAFNTDAQVLKDCAGLLGTVYFRESTVTVDLKSRRVWAKWLEPESLPDLLARIRDPAQADEHGASPLLEAVILRRSDAVQQLLEDGADPNKSDRSGVTPLLRAATSGQTEIVHQLLERGAKLDTQSAWDGYTALHAAVFFGKQQTVTQLLDAGAKVDSQLVTGRTPLFLACQFGDVDIVRELLARKASVDVGQPTGETPLMAACNSENFDCVRLLLEHGANPNAKGRNGTAMTYAATNGHANSLKLLVDHGAKLDELAPGGITPLANAAATYGAEECVRFLLENGADATVKLPSGETALDLATKSGSLESIRLLLIATQKK